MSFRVGQKVVCVDTSECFDRVYDGVRAAIAEGEVYTISWVGEFEGTACVRLLGIYRDHPGLEYWPFRASRFRPLVERKTETGMAILREILDRETHRDKPPVKAPRTESPIGTAQRE